LKPTIALVGRPNVGKSTLFNQLTRSRDALVADVPGLTRDRNYGLASLGARECWVVDTGGLEAGNEPFDAAIARQTQLAIDEAHVIVFVVDARDGLTAADENVASLLKKAGKPVLLAVNKVDGMDSAQASAEFHRLGIRTLLPIAAAHRHGVAELVDTILESLPAADPAEAAELEAHAGIRVAVVGRPNVGKSTLVNRLVGEQRVLTSPEPGTTRDTIAVPFERDGQRYVLIDTAGVRRRSRIHETVERFTVIKSLQAIDAAQVVICVLDARQGIAEQDASLLGLVLEAGHALVIAVNKWDGLADDDKTSVRRELDRRLSFVAFAERPPLSALHGSGIGKLMAAVARAYRSAMVDVPTSELTRLLQQAVQSHQPPQIAGRRIRLRYAHQGGANPPTFIIHGNQTRRLPDAYKRYLMNYFREALDLTGTPIRLFFKTGENPFADRRPVRRQSRRTMSRGFKSAR
jgi:GTP-binding protein